MEFFVVFFFFFILCFICYLVLGQSGIQTSFSPPLPWFGLLIAVYRKASLSQAKDPT